MVKFMAEELLELEPLLMDSPRKMTTANGIMFAVDLGDEITDVNDKKGNLMYKSVPDTFQAMRTDALEDAAEYSQIFREIKQYTILADWDSVESVLAKGNLRQTMLLLKEIKLTVDTYRHSELSRIAEIANRWESEAASLNLKEEIGKLYDAVTNMARRATKILDKTPELKGALAVGVAYEGKDSGAEVSGLAHGLFPEEFLLYKLMKYPTPETHVIKTRLDYNVLEDGKVVSFVKGICKDGARIMAKGSEDIDGVRTISIDERGNAYVVRDLVDVVKERIPEADDSMLVIKTKINESTSANLDFILEKFVNGAEVILAPYFNQNTHSKYVGLAANSIVVDGKVMGQFQTTEGGILSNQIYNFVKGEIYASAKGYMKPTKIEGAEGREITIGGNFAVLALKNVKKLSRQEITELGEVLLANRPDPDNDPEPTPAGGFKAKRNHKSLLNGVPVAKRNNGGSRNGSSPVSDTMIETSDTPKKASRNHKGSILNGTSVKKEPLKKAESAGPAPIPVNKPKRNFKSEILGGIPAGEYNDDVDYDDEDDNSEID